MIGIDVERRNGLSVAKPRGDIDVASAPQVRAELATCLTPDVDVLVLDLSATAYVDSAGLDMLFRLNERLRQRRARLLLVIPPGSHLARLVEIVALDRAVAIHKSVETALEAGAAGTALRPGSGGDQGNRHPPAG
jgi:anti-anti-sigma factor